MHATRRAIDARIWAGASWFCSRCALVTIAVLLEIGLLLNPGFFHAEELNLLDQVRGLELSELPWASGLGSGLFARPIAYNAHVLLLWISGGSAALAHLFCVFLHAANGLLLAGAVRQFGGDRRFARCCFLAFVASPLALGAVGWTAAICDVLVLLFLLSAVRLLSYQNACRSAVLRWLAAPGVAACVALALGAKESGIVGLPVLVAIGLLRRHDNAAFGASVALTMLVVATYAALRLQPALAAVGNESSADGGYAWGFGANVLRNAQAYFLFPFAAATFTLGKLMRAPASLELGLAAAVHLALVLVLGRMRHRGLYLAAYALPLLPVLFLHKAEAHNLYLSSVPFALVLAHLATRRDARRTKLVLGIAALLAAAHAVEMQRRFVERGIYERRFSTSLAAQLRRLVGTARRLERDLVLVADPASPVEDLWGIATPLRRVDGIELRRVLVVRGKEEAPTDAAVLGLDSRGTVVALPDGSEIIR